ncbi:TRAP transporter permease [Thermodesulforhabdus norvegica]|uniref:TRAP transporter, 4TM/12TM fusion protein n=1 Tax=Thermodesulforhabdus norvegica TaxID=39841 RepID=A0A1I4QTJ6_9BACT|nr:TRAP transporter fused permease subunit [Thermodesulforhabdus norvegica]SFM43359.1 TRAP transporter, 4TM/12TM fusion protein [Thermodesulforhabdus norvegica]
MEKIIRRFSSILALIAALYSLYWVIHPHTPMARFHVLVLDITQVSRATHVFFLVLVGYLLSWEKGRTRITPGSALLFCLSLVPLYAFLQLRMPVFYKALALIYWAVAILPTVVPGIRRFCDIAAALLCVVPYLYQVLNFEELIERAMFPEHADLVMGIGLVYLVLGLVYRFTGSVLPILVLFFFAYNLHGRKFPGVFAHAPFPVDLLIGKLYCETEAGLFGIITGVSMKYLVYFTILGGIVAALQIGKILANISAIAVGKGPDGPARVTSVASIFMGMFSGSGAADTQFVSTIVRPMYERAGYDRLVAAGVAATAGTIAMVTPPILGSMAFIMVEILSIPYLWVCIMALGPMVMYLVAILAYNAFYVRKEGIKSVEVREDLNRSYLFRYSYIFVPIFVIIACIYLGYPVSAAVTSAIFLFIIFGYIDKTVRPKSFKVILNGLASGFEHLIPIGIAVVAANIIMTLMVITGLPSKFSQFLLQLSAQNLIIATVFAAIFTLIMGMGVPPTATYVISSSLTAPAIQQIAVANGVPSDAALLATHMFLMYYAILADVTPPVALSGYAAASVFGTHPLKTGVYAAKVALPKYIFGFSFILSYYGTALLAMPMVVHEGLSHSWLSILSRYALVAVAVVLMSAATVGYTRRTLSRIESVVLFLASLLVFYPDLITGAIGVIVGAWFFIKRSNPSEKEEYHEAGVS